MHLADLAKRRADDAAKLVRLDRPRAAVLAQDPRREQGQRRVRRDEDVVLEPSVVAELALHPPRGVWRHLDPRFAGRVADLPVRPSAMVVDLELGRDAEVALAPGREADVAADARHLERADVLAHEILADDVPAFAVAEEPVRVDRALLLAVARDRPVVELGGALLRDRALELAEPAGHVGRVVRVVDLDLDAQCCRCRRRREAGTAEREVLQRQPKRFRVRELALEHVERGLERGELVVRELERREEVLLRRERVQLLAGELVAL